MREGNFAVEGVLGEFLIPMICTNTLQMWSLDRRTHKFLHSFMSSAASIRSDFHNAIRTITPQRIGLLMSVKLGQDKKVFDVRMRRFERTEKCILQKTTSNRWLGKEFSPETILIVKGLVKPECTQTR